MLLTEFTSHATGEVAAPAADVFAALTDVAALPRWNACIDRVLEPLDRPMEAGSVWVVQMKIPVPPASWPSRATCTTYDAERFTFAHRSVTDDGNPSFVEWRWQVTPLTPATSRVDVTWSVNPRTLWRRLVLARMRRPQLVAEVGRSLRTLDRQLAGAAAGRIETPES
jgi:uncharacterized protein YndB with AHSA1/START domain